MKDCGEKWSCVCDGTCWHAVYVLAVNCGSCYGMDELR